MQLLRHPRLRAALLPSALALAGLAASPAVLAVRTQEANVRPFVQLSSQPDDYNTAPRNPRSNMLLASDNNIYFASSAGGKGAGAIARVTPDGVLTTLYALKEDGSEGVSPYGTLIQASDGHLYGTAYYGGGEGGGTLFRVTLDGVFTLLHEFGGGDPNPLFLYTGVTEGPDGYLYGTSLFGGTRNKGAIYRIAKDGSDYSVILNFTGGNGENPEGGLVDGTDGYLYGTTMMGGSSNRGTVYRISPAGDHEVLYSFPRLSGFSVYETPTNLTGANPRAGLMRSTLDGNFYGTAYQGGQEGFGTLFRITPDGDLSVVHTFTGPPLGGWRPLATVTQDAAGNLYGTTEFGGYDESSTGTAWRVAPDGTFSLLHAFSASSSDGYAPYSGLLLAHDSIYAMTRNDSLRGFGAISRLDLGSGGVLPVELQSNLIDMEGIGAFTVTWNAPAGATCVKSGDLGFTGEAGPSGSQDFAPTFFDVFVFTLRCTDADDGNEATPAVVRLARLVVQVRAPPLTPVDGGGGAGTLSLWWLLLAAALLCLKVKKEA